MYSAILLEIAKRLPQPALVKFAQINTVTNDIARDAWEAWRDACFAAGICRMFSDKCWMDAYTRTLRQKSFRFVNAATLWLQIEEPPSWMLAALSPYLDAALSLASFRFCIRKDVSVINMVCV